MPYRIRTTLFLLGLVPAVAPALARAASPPEVAGPVPAVAPAVPGASLSLDEALARAEAENGLLRRARAERATVAARDVGARLLLPANPLAAFSAGPRHEDAMGMR